MTIFNVKAESEGEKKAIITGISAVDIRTVDRVNIYGAKSFSPTTADQVLSNGNFDSNADGWTLGNGWVFSGSAIVVLNPADFIGMTQSAANQINPIIVGETYEVIYTCSNYSGGTFRASVGSGGVGILRSSAGIFTEDIVATTSTTFFITGSFFPGDGFTLDTFSCTLKTLANQTVSINASKDVDISTIFSDQDVGNREVGILDKLVITAVSSAPNQCGASVFKDSSGNIQLRLTGYAAGSPAITLTATDLSNNSATKNVTVTVS